jgi:hypothetical protein
VHAGAKVGSRGEISTVSNIVPEILAINDEAFIADMAAIGLARVYMGKLMAAPVFIGIRTFIGNATLIPVGASVPDGCLIEVQSTHQRAPSTQAAPGLVCLPIYLPRRQVICFGEEMIFKPRLRAYAMRYGYEFFPVYIAAGLCLRYPVDAVPSILGKHLRPKASQIPDPL